MIGLYHYINGIYLDSLTTFFSSQYLVLFIFPLFLIYQFLPQRWRKYYLLLASYLFYVLVDGTMIVYLIEMTIITYLLGLWIEHYKEQCVLVCKGIEKAEKKTVKQSFQTKERRVLLLAIIILIGGLVAFKYSGFIFENIQALVAKFGWQISDSALISIPGRYRLAADGTSLMIMPLGISFFTLQALSYVIDVCRGTIHADRNLFKIALFMAFFPTIVEGPICRYGQTADQLWNVTRIKWDNFLHGALRYFYGMMKKLVVADRLNATVQEIFTNYSNYDGKVLALGAVLYTVQLYMDFSGCIDAAIGVAEVLGVTLPENFRRPFFSKTISEFWQRWHVTLGAWLKDYIFYPITLSGGIKKLMKKARKSMGAHLGVWATTGIAFFAVWIVNGLWHGAGWNFIFFGMYHFVIIMIGNLIAPLVEKNNTRLGINHERGWYRTLQMIRTTILVIIGEMFFEAESLKAGIGMFARMITTFGKSGINSGVLQTLGTDWKDLILVLVTVILVFNISLMTEKGIDVRAKILGLNIVVRWIIIYALLAFIIVFGAFGTGYVPVDPMYAAF